MIQFSKTDHQMMARAIQLAKRGEYTTAPNPNVGCVISDGKGVILGEAGIKRRERPMQKYML